MSDNTNSTPLNPTLLQSDSMESIKKDLAQLELEIDKAMAEYNQLVAGDKVTQIKSDMKKWIMDQK